MNHHSHKRFWLMALFVVLAPFAKAAPATDTWTGSAGTNWSTPGNWTGGNAPPQSGDSLVFGSTSGSTTLSNDLVALGVDGITFSGPDAFTFNGKSVILSGAIAGSQSGITNNSGLLQTFSTMGITLDSGFHTFSSPSGGGLALNGVVAAVPGGLAYFDANVSSTSLELDTVTGLITNLEGAALIYSGTGATPTGLATISGGTIVPYTATTPIASGAIGSGNNLELTASGAATAYSANNSTVNTLTVDQTGNSGGTATSTLTITGTLTLGQHGGVYLLGNTTGNKTCLNLSGGILTAGTSGPASIVFAINGNNANNQASCSATISNNVGGGPVTVIMAGPGSMNFATTTTSSYSGGVYVDQGQLQFGQLAQVGTGPIFVEPGGTLYYTGTGNISNNIFLSPGNGAGSSAAVAGGSGMIISGSSATLSGTLSLNGQPVPPPITTTISTPSGDTFSGDFSAPGNYTFTGEITGTGTFQLTGAHSTDIILKNTTNAANDWQGGMIIGGHGGVAVNMLVQMGATNQIPNGDGTGDIYFFPAEGSGNGFARFDLNGFNTTVNALNATTSFATAEAQLLNQTATPCTLTLGANNDSGTFNGSIIDGSSAKALSLVKIGTGTQTFGGYTNSYFGSTTVGAGTLAFANAGLPTNSSSFTIASGATLDGSGLFGGGFTFGANQSVAGLGTVVGNNTVSGKLSPFLGSIGTLTNNGTLNLNGGGTYVWSINNASGTPGADPGWSLINVAGTLNINASSSSPFVIKITSLTNGDVAGLAANFNPNVTTSWTILQSANPISSFTASAFTIDTSAFANPRGNGSFSIGLSSDQTALVLTFTSTPVITTPLVNITNNAGTIATFTVVANGATPPVTFDWFQGNNELFDGGTTLSGATVGITNNGTASTLTIGGIGVQDADAGGYTVNVTDNVGDSGSSSASLTVIDAPTNAQAMEISQADTASGGVAQLSVTAGGTQPFTYTWYKNGIALTNGGHIVSGVNGATLTLDVGPGDAGNYTVVLSNAAGVVTSAPVVISPVTVVPNQIIYEPFTSYAADPPNPVPAPSDTWENVTNLYNQLTGEPAWWFHSSGSGIEMIVIQNDLDFNNNNQNGGSYPWPDLAGDSTNILYYATGVNNHLDFEREGFTPGTSVYVSFLLDMVSVGSVNGVQDVIAGFVSPNDGTAFNLKICSQVYNAGANQLLLGIAKGAGTTGSQGVDANTIWSTPIDAQQVVFVVACYQVNSGGTNNDDTVSMWINPDHSTFYASGTNVPPPDYGPASFGVANSSIRDFAVHGTVDPASHRIADLRIGTTWASVTPPSAPTLSLADVTTSLGATAVLMSENAGNPVTTYQWSFDGGPPLTDNSHISGSSTGTLTITGVTSADIGTYTVTGSNTDPITSSNLVGSASASLSIGHPVLNVSYNPPNVVISWSTNFGGFTLQGTPSLVAPNWTPVTPQTVVGTNYTVTVNAGSGNQFFRLKQ